MKRLLCILSSMNAGGAETFLMKLYRNMDRTCFQMDFCINSEEKCFYEDEIINLGGRIYRIPAKSNDLRGYRKQLAVTVKDNKYEYVLRVTSSAMGFMDLKVAKKAGARVCCARSSNASGGGGVKSFLAHRVGKMLYSSYVDVKIAPSDLAAKYTFGKSAYNSGKVKILHNAIDLHVYRYDEQKSNEIREEFSILPKTKVIGHIGRFAEQKNHSFLVEIFKEIHNRDKDTVLLLVGDGPLRKQIEKKAEELGILANVIFAGVRSDIPALLSAMDVFVFPSFYEGMPNTVIEAQATGLPCLISDTITKEANVTGLVDYLELSKDARTWAEYALHKVAVVRKDTYHMFIKEKYDIQTIEKEFVDLIFNK